ncbi:MAG: hypothetical protein R3F24_13015 [Gammaproteobacteria bacterium]
MRRRHVGLPGLVLVLVVMAGPDAVAGDLSGESLDLTLTDPQGTDPQGLFNVPAGPPNFTAGNLSAEDESPPGNTEPGFRFTLKPDAPDLFVGWQFEF